MALKESAWIEDDVWLLSVRVQNMVLLAGRMELNKPLCDLNQ
jgi:hypothetical protein